MLRGLDDFILKPTQYKTKFLTNCIIEEKVSAFYFHVKILSKTVIKIYKSDYKELSQEDLIMNKMWKDPYIEIPQILFNNPEVLDQMIGWTLSFFYFPVEKPLLVEYDLSEGWKYMLAFAVDERKKPIDISDIDMSLISTLFRSKPYILKDSKRTEEEKHAIKDAVKSNDVGVLIDLIEDLIDKSDKNSNMLANSLQEAEGLVLRWKGDIYQIVYNAPNEKVKDNRLSFEFFIHMFCQWLKSTDYTECLSQSYIKSVCNLFYCFKKGWLDDNGKDLLLSYYNINPEDLEAPTFGYYSGTYFELIPHKLVREWCMKDKMYDNMFKILLNALKKTRNPSKSSMLVTEEDTKEWNLCVGNIKKYTRPLYFNIYSHL